MQTEGRKTNNLFETYLRLHLKLQSSFYSHEIQL